MEGREERNRRPAPQDSDATPSRNLDRKIPLSYEHNRQRRCAPMSGNLKPESVATFTEIRTGRLGSAAGVLVIQGLGSDAGSVDLEKTIEFMNTATTLPMTV
jgi:hypothetical protein